MRFLLVACVLVLGWYGLYSLAKELSRGSLALTTLSEVAALTKRPALKPFYNASAESSDSIGQRTSPTLAGAFESMPLGQGDGPEVMASSFWVEVLYPARLHRGPSVDTPIIGIEPIGTKLRVSRARQGWFEVSEPKTGDSGWIYGKYIGDVGDPTKVQIASANPSSPPSAQVAASINDGPSRIALLMLNRKIAQLAPGPWLKQLFDQAELRSTGDPTETKWRAFSTVPSAVIELLQVT
jgi:hypothetical protein